MCTETPFSCARQRSLMCLAVLQLRHGRRSGDAAPELSAEEGSDPPVRGPGTGSDAGVFSHPCPRPLGVAPVQISLAGRLPSVDVQVGESSTHRCSQARVLPVKQTVPSRRGRTRRRGDNAARTRQGPATHLGSPCARTRDHPGRHLAAGTAERPAALADAQDRRDHGR